MVRKRTLKHFSMDTRRPVSTAITAAALLFAPFLYLFIVGFLSQRRNPTAPPDWVIYVRVLSVGLAIIAPALAFFTERQIRLLPAEKLSPVAQDLELIVFLTGSSLFLAPATISVISSLAGAPAADIYLSSAFSFLGVLFWSWRKRALFRVSNNYPIDTSQDDGVPAQTVLFMRGYTIILGLLGILALLFLALRIIARKQGFVPNSGFVSMEIFLSALYTILVLGCWITVLLRARKSQYAPAATGVISAALLCWIPIGTAAFIYWFGWVRKKEINC